MSNQTDIFEAIVAANKIFIETFGRGDAAGIAALYTEDAQFLPPNCDAINGQEAIEGAFQAFMDMGVKSVNLETLEVEGIGDTATEVGKYTLQDANGQQLDQGKFLVVWKQVAGQWKLHRDMINTSMPAPE